MMLKFVCAAALACGVALPTVAAAQNGHFDGHVDAVWTADGRHMILQKPITFIDSQGKAWPVPAGAETDGASIPQAFWWIIGGPFEGKYRDAAVIHDFYCDVRRRNWQDVDRMFYDAMLSSGVPAPLAKALFYAVWSQGPHWDDQTLNNVWLSYPTSGGPALIAAAGPAPPAPAAPQAYTDAKSASRAAHDAHILLESFNDAASLAPETSTFRPIAEMTGDLSPRPRPAPVKTKSSDPQDVAVRIATDDPPLAEVEAAAEAARQAIASAR